MRCGDPVATSLVVRPSAQRIAAARANLAGARPLANVDVPVAARRDGDRTPPTIRRAR
jgi:hypothetical protein